MLTKSLDVIGLTAVFELCLKAKINNNNIFNISFILVNVPKIIQAVNSEYVGMYATFCSTAQIIDTLNTQNPSFLKCFCPEKCTLPKT